MHLSPACFWPNQAQRREQALTIQPFLAGTFFPALRASDNPIAIACFLLVTLLPLRPLFNFPCFIARISRSTLFPAAGEYLRVDLLLLVDFFSVVFFFDVLGAIASPCQVRWLPAFARLSQCRGLSRPFVENAVETICQLLQAVSG